MAGGTRRSPRRIVLIVLVQLVIGLPLVELALRALLPPPPTTNDIAVPTEAALRARAGETRHDGGDSHYDAEGYRDEPHLPDANRTVLFLGDSFTQGYGVPDGASFVARTERALADRGVHARCLDAGISGVGTPQELLALRERIVSAAPNAVVLQVFPFNDLADAHADGRFSIENGALVEHASTGPRSIHHDPTLTERFYVLRVLDGWLPHGPVDTIPAFDDADITLELRLLEEVVRTAREHAVAIVIAIVGERNECARDAPPRTPYARVLDAAASLGAPLVPLCETTRDASDFRADGHYTEDANGRVGEVLAEALAPLLR